MALLAAVVALFAIDGKPLLPHVATGPSIARAPSIPHPAGTTLPPIQASSAAPVAGWIVDGAGKPVDGVTVTLRDPKGVLPDVIATSEADGAFRIDTHLLAGEPRQVLLDAPHVFPAEVTWQPKGPPPRILLARRASVVARVMANGAPVVGAEVQITDGSRPTLATATSDADGLVKFDDLLPGPYELWARRDMAVSPLVRVPDVGAENAPEVVLALAAGTRIRGQVFGGEPLPANATVQLAPLGVDHVARTATLDSAGRFAIEGLPKGRWRVEALIPHHVQTGEVVAESSAAREVAVRIQRAGTVSGTVVDVNGAPVANATIVLRQQGVVAQPESPVAMAPTTTARLRWVHPLAGTRLLPIFDITRFGAPRPGTRPAECGQGHCGVDLGTIRGTVIHAAADGTVSAIHAESRGEAGRLVAIDHGDGLRTMYMHLDEIRPGLEVGHRLRGGDPLGTLGSTGFSKPVPHLHFAVTQERAGRTWYIDPEPIIRHAVVLPTPRPLDVSLVPAALASSVRWKDVLGPTTVATSAPRELATDAQGKFVLEDVGPGTYVAVGFAAALAPGVSAPFTVRTGSDTGGVIVTLRPGVLVTGRVLGRDGPLAGATVTASAGFGETANKVATTYTDARGEFTLRALSGKLTLTASAPGYGDLDRDVTLDDGHPSRTRHREEFVLVIENSELRGQVLAPDGGAAGVVTLQVIDGPTRRSAQSDAQGRFTLARVATGTYVVELSSPEYPSKRVTLVTDRYKELRLDVGGGLRIDVRDQSSRAPLANIRIDATGPDGRRASRTTDATGTAELRGLVPGEWKLAVRAPGFASRTQAFAVRAGRVSEPARIELARGAIVGGVVRDRFGRRVAGAKVTVGDASTITDRDGNYRLADVAAGDLVIEAELGDAKGSLSVRVAPGDDRSTIDIELAE